jgi:type II secretory pathway component PulC
MSRAIAFLALAIAALGGFLAWQWVDANGQLRDVHWQRPAAIKPNFGQPNLGLTTAEQFDAGRFMAILDRPLFSPTRRPPPPPKPVVVPQPDPLDTVHLFGIFSGADGGGIIIRVDGRTRRVKIGESVGDWRLKEIRGRDAIFSRGSETRSTTLFQAKQLSGGMPAPAAPPAAASANTPSAATQTPPPQAATRPPSSGFVIGGSR